ncbi:uncharacterized protein LOC115722091 isoform X1 [Cannabis sativa]|uniref:Uncharacterized protein n=1 Tax=Cannabis sativa TaxID=3483 RepID=A0A7J6EAF5_CANSA|nr:uncharacterized protein LOC115722091 isoform X1 [Cannabis sativa]KAF4355326.1 hypothetical protein F8388_026596 [Cannabis sativa]KAF4367284.1 hypothetical protein G4B88_026791 [Cannabis sativa]
MKSKQTPFRAVGQRSIVSSLLNPSSKPSRVPKEGCKNLENVSRISLSDFLQRKLNDDSGLPKTVKGKAKPFSSLLGLRDGSVDEKIGASNVVEKVVLEQFKHIETVTKDDLVGSSSDNGNNGEVENIASAAESRKRKSFEGRNEKHIPRKQVVVLGGNSKAKQQRRDKYIRNENQVPTYNHYANGGGWWDSNMEGVDNEEVGFSEVWEGVGSTTFGGSLDWH